MVTDGVNRFKLPDNFVTNVKIDDVKAALAANFMSRRDARRPYTPIVVNTGGKLVVIDTGTGEANFTQSKGAVGQFAKIWPPPASMPEAIDTVIISHYHGDHVNGLLKADGSLAFPTPKFSCRRPSTSSGWTTAR